MSNGLCALSWPPGDGEMARLVREHRWEATPLGAIETWPLALRTAVELVLAAPVAAIVLWGPSLLQIYNDRWAAVHPGKHPHGMGASTYEVFPELAEVLRPLYAKVLSGQGVELAESLLPVLRNGSLQNAWWNVTYIPLRDDTGAIAGIFCTLAETTCNVIAGRALKESEARLRALVNPRIDRLCRMSADWKIMYQLDSSTLANTSEPIHDWVGKYILSEDLPQVSSAIQEAIRTKSIFELEHRVLLADGQVGWVLSRAVPIFDADGEILEWFGTGKDITANKRAEAALRESEERQAFLLKLGDELRPLDNPLEVQEAASRLLAEHLGVNRAMYSEFEGEGAERIALIRRQYVLEGTPFPSRVPDAVFIEGKAGDLLRAGETLVVEDAAQDTRFSAAARDAWLHAGIVSMIAVGLVKHDREVAHFGIHNAKPRVWTPGELSLVREVAERTRSAGERARAEVALRASEERFRLFVQNVREYALVQTDFEGTVTSWNPGAERLFGYSSEEIVGKPFVTLLPDADRHDGIIAREMAILSRGEKNVAEHTVQRKDGTQFWAEWVTEPVLDDAGKLRGTAKVMRDETEREQSEKAIRNSLAEKEELLKEVHHRVKNNLQVITSLLNLQSAAVTNPQTLALFEETRNRVQAISAIHELLYRSESFASLSLRTYAEQLMSSLVRFYNMQDRVRTETTGDDSTIELERAVPFGLLLNELVSNAMKHAFPEHATGTVHITIERAKQRLILRVSDTGVGLPPSFQYEQSTSLGLKLVQILMRQLRGEIRVVPGAGTTFEASMPFKP